MIPWSYSFLNDLANCPQKAYRKFVKRDLPKETSPELEEGIRVHTMLEEYINRSRSNKAMPPEYVAHAQPLIGQGAKAEVKLGMTKDMLPEQFFGDPWGRGKLDVLIMKPPDAFIVDWKTGKVREDDRELRQQALLVRANYPDITRISGCYVWLKEGKMGKIYDLTDVNRTYHGTVAEMDKAEFYEREGEWPVTPNALCGWCPVAECRFNTNPKAQK